MPSETGLGMSADSIYFWVNWFLVGALLVAGVLATYAIVLGKIRDDALSKELETQRNRSAELEKQAEELKLSVAQATERAGIAEQRAADANLALERFKAPRALTESQAESLRANLKPFSGMAIDFLRFGETLEIVAPVHPGVSSKMAGPWRNTE